jgi:hypothetical protein
MLNGGLPKEHMRVCTQRRNMPLQIIMYPRPPAAQICNNIATDLEEGECHLTVELSAPRVELGWNCFMVHGCAPARC